MDIEKLVDRARMIVTADDSGKLIVLIRKQPGDTHAHFGMMLADCARHAAKAFDVEEDAVFGWIDRERDHPSAKVEGGKVQ